MPSPGADQPGGDSRSTAVSTASAAVSTASAAGGVLLTVSSSFVWSSQLGDPTAPLDLVVGECFGYCGAAIDAQEGRLGAALTVDVKPSRAKVGLHYQGDVRVILFSRPWRRVFAFPPCDHLAFSGSQYFESKLASGLSWYGLSFAALCYCAPAEIVVVENSRGLLGECWRREAQILQPHEFGLGRSGRAETKATAI